MTPKKKMAEQSPAGVDKGELRRQQVLDAATECFRREGIHGTSIARICQAAGMSPGHIYHYFENKEAIVEAIAERERNDLAGMLEGLQAEPEGTPLVDRMVAQSHRMQARMMDAERVGLMLELAAEGARNPAVRAILQRTDGELQASFMEGIRNMDLLTDFTETELNWRMELVISLKVGMALRSVQNAELDVAALQPRVDEVLRFLLTPPACG